MTSASTGWALRWTVSPWSTQAGYLVPARTTDGARTWTDVTPRAAVALLKTPYSTVVLDALDANRAYLAVTAATTQDSGPHPTVVFGTGDGGRTWTESAPFQAPAPASLLSFAGPDDGWLLASYGGTMGQTPSGCTGPPTRGGAGRWSRRPRRPGPAATACPPGATRQGWSSPPPRPAGWPARATASRRTCCWSPGTAARGGRRRRCRPRPASSARSAVRCTARRSSSRGPGSWSSGTGPTPRISWPATTWA